MSNLQIICELCQIIEMLVEVVNEQAASIEQMGVVLEIEQREEAFSRYRAMIGADEMPDMPDEPET